MTPKQETESLKEYEAEVLREIAEETAADDPFPIFVDILREANNRRKNDR